MLAWVTFLAGGVYTWVWAPAAALMFAVAFAVRPPIARGARDGHLDAVLLAVLLGCLLQNLPLPVELIERITPRSLVLRRALWLPRPLMPDESQWIPLSISPSDTLQACGILLSALVMFWVCRRVCEQGGAGRIVRAITVIGLIASIAAIAQHAVRIDLLYGVWQPLDVGARPYGPFVNRNHLATWIIMACPLVFGYVLARAPDHQPPMLLSQRIANALMQLGTMRIWLVVSICVMTLAVMLSASRSGLIGLTTAFVVSTALSRRRGTVAMRRWVILQFALLAIVAVWFANHGVLLRRLDESITRAQEGRGRVAIWRDAIRMIQDFPFTGTGAGTFGRAINAYQTAEPGYAIDQAHNHYLQFMAEGGALLVLPGVVAAGLFLVVASRTLTRDRSRQYLIRAGACAGMTGVLVQSVWETGLTMPANALLFAIVAAIATSGEPRVAGTPD